MDSSYKAYFHLPGLFEFYELYSRFLKVFYTRREYFYDWCYIGSIYGAPTDCIWAGGRVEYGEVSATKVLELMKEYGISARLTFSNSLLKPEHLKDEKCNNLCRLFETAANTKNGVIVHSDILANYIKSNYPNLYLVSSTTKVITEYSKLLNELNLRKYDYVVPDFRFNKERKFLRSLSAKQKAKIEFLCNECCRIECNDRKKCYEAVSAKNLGIADYNHICTAPKAQNGYKFSEAMKNPSFIGIDDIKLYLTMGFSNFKIEGRGLGSALVLEFLLYYMVKPEYQLNVREEIYLDNMLDLF